MARLDALELLDHLLDGGSLDAEHIDQILGEVIPEGVHLEYKGWPFIQKDEKDRKGDAAGQLRRYVAGFANSDGGVLLIGFAEQRDADGRVVAVTLDGDPTSKEAADPAALCSRALTEISHVLVPPPRIQVVTHDGKPIVALAVARAPNLVWCAVDRRPTFFLRLEDQTLKAPEYLHADIVTGRRARPAFEVREPLVSVGKAEVEKSHRFIIEVSVTNTSLVWVEKALLGMICYRHTDEGWNPVGPALLAYVDDQKGDYGAHLAAHAEDLSTLPPFGVATATFEVEFPVPAVLQDRTDKYVWRAVLCLLPANNPPSFWQLEMSGSTYPRHGVPGVVATALRDGHTGIVSLAGA